MKLFFAFYSFIVMTAILGGAAFAQETVGADKGIPAGPQTGATLLVLLTNIADWIFAFAMVGAIIFIVLAGFKFISSGGDANAVSEARRSLLYGAIGIAVAVMAKGIPVVVRNIIGFGTGGGA